MKNPRAQRDVDKRMSIEVAGACIEALENTLKPGQQPGDATKIEHSGEITIERVLEGLMQAKVSSHEFIKDSQDNYFRVLEDGKKIPIEKAKMKKMIKAREEANLTVNMTEEEKEDIIIE